MSINIISIQISTQTTRRRGLAETSVVLAVFAGACTAALLAWHYLQNYALYYFISSLPCGELSWVSWCSCLQLTYKILLWAIVYTPHPIGRGSCTTGKSHMVANIPFAAWPSALPSDQKHPCCCSAGSMEPDDCGPGS